MTCQKTPTTSNLRALSLLQPWLYAITDLDKTVENRTWAPPRHILGRRIALHASKRKSAKEWDHCQSIHGSPITTVVPVGAIVATAQIDDTFWNKADMELKVLIHWDSAIKAEARAALANKWFFGPYGWRLSGIHKLDEPIPCHGMLSLWQVPEDIALEINKQLLRDGIIKAAI